jgi:hypothetical protein
MEMDRNIESRASPEEALHPKGHFGKVYNLERALLASNG